METFDISGWKRARDKKFHEREVRRKILLKEAREKLAWYFAAVTEIKSVYLTGSLLQADKFHKFSDVDIAVEGLPETAYFRTKVELEKLLNVTVDLIELESCSFRHMIMENGLKII